MKERELVHKVRQLFMGTRIIENRLKYLLLCIACSIPHFVFTVLFFLSDVHFLFAINLFATVFYIMLAFASASRAWYKTLFIAAFIEVEINATISSIMLGPGYDFMIYTLALIPGAFYMAHTWPVEAKNKYNISMIPTIATIIEAVMYIVVDISQTFIKPYYDGEKILAFRPIFHYISIMIAVVSLLIFALLFALEVRYIQKLLNDENSRLGEIASRDPLTKAYNRRSLYNIINETIEKNPHTKFGLIILDVDDFKKVNDTYGHDMGDEVLIRVASVMKESLREGDNFCRWGGEEFLFMIHGNEEDYGIVAERIRTGIEKQVFHSKGLAFSVTATLGIAEYQTGIQIRTLVDMADQKLYFGKKHGKNQVVR